MSDRRPPLARARMLLVVVAVTTAALIATAAGQANPTAPPAAARDLAQIYFAGANLKGPEALRDALDPWVAKTYLMLLPLMPGALLLWIGDHIAARRRGYGRR